MPSRSLLEDLDGCCSALQWAVGVASCKRNKNDGAPNDAIITKLQLCGVSLDLPPPICGKLMSTVIRWSVAIVQFSAMDSSKI